MWCAEWDFVCSKAILRFFVHQQRLERTLHCRAGIGDHCIYRNAVVVEDWVGLPGCEPGRNVEEQAPVGTGNG